MTDLEREASEIVRAVLDEAARQEGYKDLLDSDWSVDQAPFKARIVRLVDQYVAEAIRVRVDLIEGRNSDNIPYTPAAETIQQANAVPQRFTAASVSSVWCASPPPPPRPEETRTTEKL